jgi:hypothetical protein
VWGANVPNVGHASIYARWAVKLRRRRKAPARFAQYVSTIDGSQDGRGSVGIDFAGFDVARLIDHSVKELAHGLG